MSFLAEKRICVVSLTHRLSPESSENIVKLTAGLLALHLLMPSRLPAGGQWRVYQ
jgi:hypothetical protein